MATTIPLGSIDHPVTLDEQQEIVEVHWRTGDQFIAYALLIERRSVVKDYPFPANPTGGAQTDQPVDWTSDVEPSPVAGGGGFGHLYYVTGFQYEFAEGEPSLFGYRWTGSEWKSTAIESLGGLPELPDVQAVAPWTVLFNVRTLHNVLSWWPRAEYLPVTGGGIEGMFAPDHPDIAFVDASSASLQMRGVSFSAGPLQGEFGDVGRTPYTNIDVNVKYGTFSPYDFDAETGFDHTFGSFAFSIAGMSLVHQGKAYHAVGAALHESNAANPTSPGTLFVLFEKDED